MRPTGVANHRSPVLPAGKENIQLPPIDSSRGRGGVSASRQDQLSNLRSNGAAIMGVNSCGSARNLRSYASGSQNGSDGVRDSINLGQRKYQGGQQARPYVKGACYGVDIGQSN